MTGIFTPGAKILCYGIVGGPFKATIVRKGESTGCWVVRFKTESGAVRLEEVHEDYLGPRKARKEKQ